MYYICGLHTFTESRMEYLLFVSIIVFATEAFHSVTKTNNVIVLGLKTEAVAALLSQACMCLCQGFINLTQLNTAQLSACCLLLQSSQIPLFPDLAPNHVVLPVSQFWLEQD